MRLFTGFIIVTRHAYKSIIIAVKTEQPQFCAFLYFYQKSYQYALFIVLILIGLSILCTSIRLLLSVWAMPQRYARFHIATSVW